MFEHLALRDALQPYLGKKHALRGTCSELRCAYCGPSPMILKLKDPCYRAYFITLPTHPKKLDAVILGIMRKGLFLLEISEMSCFYEVVYGVEQDRRDTAKRLLTLKPHIAACVQTIYIDCHWIGYVAVTTRPDGLWKVKPVYKADDTDDAPFDFCAFRKEVHVHLEG